MTHRSYNIMMLDWLGQEMVGPEFASFVNVIMMLFVSSSRSYERFKMTKSLDAYVPVESQFEDSFPLVYTQPKDLFFGVRKKELFTYQNEGKGIRNKR